MKKVEWRIAAARGATTTEEDTAVEISERTTELLETMIERNGIAQEDIVSIIFTATPDLVSEFPAVAARGIGLSHVPLLCSQEIPVRGSVERCIRVLMHVYTKRNTGRRDEDIRHVYLRGAKQLRTDLPE